MAIDGAIVHMIVDTETVQHLRRGIDCPNTGGDTTFVIGKMASAIAAHGKKDGLTERNVNIQATKTNAIWHRQGLAVGRLVETEAVSVAVALGKTGITPTMGHG